MSKNILIKSLGTCHYTSSPLHEEISVCFHSKKFHGGGGGWWWYIAIIESALGPDLESRERE